MEPTNTWDEILPGLWMGGTPDEQWLDIPYTWAPGVRRDERPFDVVVTLFALAQPFSWGVQELRFGFSDGNPAYIDMQQVIEVAAWAHGQWSAGRRVLIRCQAGLNRSGLITALVLLKAGWPVEEAIEHIRACRSSSALCNQEFVDWLSTHGADLAAQQSGSQIS